MSEISTEAYKGVRDFYPREWALELALFEKMREVLLSYGYEEYNASPLERAELYEAKTSEEIVNEQTYTFTDRGDRRVTLRPEMTPTLARMVAGKRRELALPLRWFSIPNVFRYERPQKGRLREHYQLNVDLLGIQELKADGEVITLAHTLLTSFGAINKDFVIRINSRALLSTACKEADLTTEAERAYLRLLDKKSKMRPEEFAAAREAITKTDPLERVDGGELTPFIEAFAARGITNVVFDPSLVRGFDYYTGIVFEIFDTNPENPRSILAGGRYDNLVESYGGEAVPAVGFGMGEVTLIDFLATHDLLPQVHGGPELYLGTPRGDDLASANMVAEQLRRGGLRIFVNLTGKSLGDQVRDASRRAIPYFAAVGEVERASGELKVKRLATGEERVLPLARVPGFISGLEPSA